MEISYYLVYPLLNLANCWHHASAKYFNDRFLQPTGSASAERLPSPLAAKSEEVQRRSSGGGSGVWHC
jgi:hypothetical protein